MFTAKGLSQQVSARGTNTHTRRGVCRKSFLFSPEVFVYAEEEESGLRDKRQKSVRGRGKRAGEQQRTEREGGGHGGGGGSVLLHQPFRSFGLLPLG